MKKAILATALTLASGLTQANTIDIAILYSDEAAANTSNIQTKINQLISFSNQVYSQNEINLRLNLVASASIGSAQVTADENWLNALTDSTSIAQYRDANNADMVALLGVGSSAGSNLISCGIAWVGQGSNGNLYSSQVNKMYSITAVDCGATTFVHELGHNQGLTHARRQGDTSGGVYKDGMGHGVYNVFTSIMAYPHVFGSATQYDYFSNPNWTANGYPFGVEGESYAWKTVNATKDDIANMK